MHAFDSTRDSNIGGDVAVLAVDGAGVAAAVMSRSPAAGAYAVHALVGGTLLVRQARADGLRPAELLARLSGADDPFHAFDSMATAGDFGADEQLMLAGVDGRVTSYCGLRCPPWSGLRHAGTVWCLTRRGVSAATAQAAVDACTAAGSAVADRLIMGLVAAQYVEGNRRRMRSAALMLCDRHGVTTDLRVDDHRDPLDELQRLLQLHRFHFSPAGPQDSLPLTPELTCELQALLHAGGYLRSDINGIYDAPTYAALERWLHDEQLEQRFRPDAAIDRQVLDYLRRRRWR